MRKWFNLWDGNDWVNVGDTFRVGKYVGNCVAVEYRPDLYSRLCCMEVENEVC